MLRCSQSLLTMADLGQRQTRAGSQAHHIALSWILTLSCSSCGSHTIHELLHSSLCQPPTLNITGSLHNMIHETPPLHALGPPTPYDWFTLCWPCLAPETSHFQQLGYQASSTRGQMGCRDTFGHHMCQIKFGSVLRVKAVIKKKKLQSEG